MWKWLVLLLVLVVVGLGLSLMAQAEVPAPTGPYAIGRTTLTFVDDGRAETATADPHDLRELPVVVWYPAVTGTGTSGGYFPGLSDVRDGLRQSGEVDAIELWGLPLLRTNEAINAEIAGNPDRFPLVIFSPGAGTNVEFYTALADELASNGYVVVGLNHPYDVAAARLSNGDVAVLQPGPADDRGAHAVERVAQRTADIRFVLDRLATLSETGGELASRLDFNRVAVLGHSLGGIAAAEACTADPRFDVCVNYDGLQAGGPFAATNDAAAPTQPFLFVTKEPNLAPALIRLLEQRAEPTIVVFLDHADHDSFTDGPVLLPTILPVRGEADRNLDLIRRATLTFLAAALGGRPAVLVNEDGMRVETFGGG